MRRACASGTSRSRRPGGPIESTARTPEGTGAATRSPALASLWRTRLPVDCRYVAVDVSPKMVALARTTLAEWSDRASVDLTEGSMSLESDDAQFDHFVCTYVLDLLSPEDTESLLSEARRVLRPGGLLCLAGLTVGTTPSARLLTSLWRRAWRVRPWLVGGCRPVAVAELLTGPTW